MVESRHEMTSAIDIESERRQILAVSCGLDAALFDVKRLPPRAGDGVIARPRLLRRLAEAHRRPLVLISAPAGYGKTTLVSDWMSADDRPFAWVTLDGADNDASRLLLSVAHALDEIEPIAIDVYKALLSPHPRLSTVVLPRFGRALRERQAPFVLVLDDAHVLVAPEPLEVIATVVDRLPPGSQLVLCSRAEPPLSIGGLRADRGLVEIHAHDLAMSTAEAAALLRQAGVEMSADDVAELVEQAEGWPAGLRLAALSGGDHLRLSGNDEIVSDYIRDEFLSELSANALTFLIRTSVLDHLCGPLCDAVLRRRGSAHVLRKLARSNLPLVRLEHGEYRYHVLLAQMLRAELRRLEPELERDLHLRASEWHAQAGDVRRAIDHAVAAREVHRAGDLLWKSVHEYVPRGGNPRVQRWLGGFSDEEIAAYAPLALAAANSCFALGDLDLVQHWTDAAERSAQHESGIAIMRAAISAQGIGRMSQDAMRAYDLEPLDSPWRAICCLFLGVSHQLRGDREAAVRWLEEGVRRGAIPAPNVQALCLAQLALTAIDAGDWEHAAVFAARASAQVDRCALGDYPTSALVFAVAAHVHAHRGVVEEAKAGAHRATLLLEGLRDFVPWYQAETRIALARAATRLGDLSRARKLLGEAQAAAGRTPDATHLPVWIEEATARAGALSSSGATGLATLTTAELRILQFLPTHLSFREIGERLYVSANTVKTQAHAVYRKLAVGSRSEAVARAFELGMLGADPDARSDR
jgi:LuxR family maltose regulon positive regulatory protein